MCFPETTLLNFSLFVKALAENRQTKWEDGLSRPPARFAVSESHRVLLAAECLHGPGIRLPLLLNGLFQDHILHLYGATLLGSANISHLVPFVNAFPPSFSQAVPAFHT